MATYYWVGGSGNWDATTTTNWASSSGGAGGAGVPTSADNVIFDAGSNVGTGAFTVTVTGTTSSPAVCNDFSTGGAGGALDGAMTLSLSATSFIDCYGSMTLPATNFTWSGSTGAAVRFRATTTGKTITTNGVGLTGTKTEFNGVGGGWTLGSALSYGSGSFLEVSAGTFDTGNYNITGGAFSAITASTKTINLGSSTLTLSATNVFSYTGSNLTFNANTSQITCSAASPTFNGGGLTFYNVSFTSAASGTTTITGDNTFNNLTQTSRSADGQRFFNLGGNQTVSGTLTLGAANTAVRRIEVVSNTIGTQRTITLNGTLATLADVDFRDIATAGTAGTWTGTRIGDGLNNSGITFDAPKTVYWNLAAGGNWSSTGWATGSGVAPAANNFPLPQDTAIIEDTGLNTGATITVNASWFLPAISAGTRTNAYTLAIGTNNPTIYKNLTLSSAATITGTGQLRFWGYGNTQTITSAGVSLPLSIDVSKTSGTLQLLDNLTNTSTTAFNHVFGTLDLSSGNRTLTCVAFNSNSSNTRSILFGTGNITVTGNAATVLAMNIANNFSYTGTPTINATYSGSTGTRSIRFGSTSGATESNALNLNISAGTDIVNISTSQFKNVNFTGFAGTLDIALNITVYGNLTMSTGMTTPSTVNSITFGATSGTQQLTSSGKTFDFPITQNNPGATLQLQDNLTMGSTRTFTLTAGTLDLSSGNRTLSTGLFSSSNSNTRAITFGTGQIDVTGNNGSVWNTDVSTNFSYTGTPTVNFTYSGSTGTRNIFGSSDATATESNVVNINVTAGSDIVAVTGTRRYKNVNFTGFSGTLDNASSARSLYGSLTLSPTMTMPSENSGFVFRATSGTQQITSNGKTLDFPITINGVGGTTRLEDNLTIGDTRTLTLTNGTLNVNSKVLSVGTVSTNNSNTRVIAFGTSGQITVTGSGSAFDATTSTGLSITGTGTISMTSASAKTFVGGGGSYKDLNQGGSGALTITGSNTFTDIKNSTQPATITFAAGSTQTVSAFTASGTTGNLITLNSDTSGTKFTLSKSSGVVTVTNCEIYDSSAIGGAVWNAFETQGNVNTSTNYGWNFGNEFFGMLV